jgi:hypothetical protein
VCVCVCEREREREEKKSIIENIFLKHNFFLLVGFLFACLFNFYLFIQFCDVPKVVIRHVKINLAIDMKVEKF